MAGPQLGDLLAGKYRIRQNLAAGAMGVVYLAEHVSLQRQVAIKVLRPELCNEPDLVSRFEQEARAASSIGDPHIVEVFDLGRTSDGGMYMVMELLEGRALAEILAAETQLSIDRAVDLVAQTLSALAAAHRNHIIHRDLKPENIFVIETEARPSFVKLLDFGISKVLAGHAAREQRGTLDGTLLGTPEYMPPELARGEVQNVDARADIYAAGIVLYEALCGCTPYQGANYNAILTSVLTGNYTSTRVLRPEIPAPLEEVIRIALSRDREHRFPTAMAMRERLLAAMKPEAALELPADEIHLPLTVDEPASLVPLTPHIPIVAHPPSGPAIMIARNPARLTPSRGGTLAQPPPLGWSATWFTLRIVAVVIVAAVAVGVYIRYLHHSSSATRQAPFAVDIAPDGAELLVDGHPALEGALDLPPGEHVLVVRAPGFLPRRVSFTTRGDPGQISVRLGHLLTPFSARDVSGPATANRPPPTIPPDIDATFTKLDGLAVCVAASDEVHRMQNRLLAAHAVPKPPVMSLDPHGLRDCTDLVARDRLPALAELDTAAHELQHALETLGPLFYAPTTEPLVARLHEFVAIDESFRHELRAARLAVEEAELALLGTDGHTTAWLMRRFALAAEAWAAAGPAAPARLARLDDADHELSARMGAHPEELAAIQEGAAFLTAATSLVALAHGPPAPTRTAAEAWNRLATAFDAMTTN